MTLDFRDPSPELCEAINAVQAALFTLDSAGRIEAWSGGAERITGFSAEEVAGEPTAMLSADEPDLSLAGLWERLQSGEPFAEGMITLRHREGHGVYLLGDLRPLRREGALIGAAGVLTDLTLHVRSNQRLAVVQQPENVRRVFSRMVGQSPAMQQVFEQIEQAATVDVTVLIRGDTGTGKELAAHAIHALSTRKGKPLVCVNCSAIPDPLLESELFGHVRGAFTGAVRDKRGVFEAAQGGVLFLDEIGDLGPTVQVKLLRALQEREIRRVGSEKTVKVDVRVVSATHRDLAALVAAGQFREDLYYRLRVFELTMPPLRARAGDVPVLVGHFVEEFSRRHGKPVDGLTPEALTCVEAYRWPGNVRELRNAIEHAFVTVRGGWIEPGDLPAEVRAAGSALPALPLGNGPQGAGDGKDDERARIVAALRAASGRKAVAASLLGISRVTLWKKIKRLGINPVYGTGDDGG